MADTPLMGMAIPLMAMVMAIPLMAMAMAIRLMAMAMRVTGVIMADTAVFIPPSSTTTNRKMTTKPMMKSGKHWPSPLDTVTGFHGLTTISPSPTNWASNITFFRIWPVTSTSWPIRKEK